MNQLIAGSTLASRASVPMIAKIVATPGIAESRHGPDTPMHPLAFAMETSTMAKLMAARTTALSAKIPRARRENTVGFPVAERESAARTRAVRL